MEQFFSNNSVDLPKIGGISTAVMTLVKAICNGWIYSKAEFYRWQNILKLIYSFFLRFLNSEPFYELSVI